MQEGTPGVRAILADGEELRATSAHESGPRRLEEPIAQSPPSPVRAHHPAYLRHCVIAIERAVANELACCVGEVDGGIARQRWLGGAIAQLEVETFQRIADTLERKRFRHLSGCQTQCRADCDLFVRCHTALLLH